MKVHATGTCSRCFYSNYVGFKYTLLSVPAKQQEIPKGPSEIETGVTSFPTKSGQKKFIRSLFR